MLSLLRTVSARAGPLNMQIQLVQKMLLLLFPAVCVYFHISWQGCNAQAIVIARLVKPGLNPLQHPVLSYSQSRRRGILAVLSSCFVTSGIVTIITQDCAD